MEIAVSILAVLGLIILGFLIAEFQNAHLGKQLKDTTKLYFTFVGVEFTQKDIQRLLFAVFLGIGFMFIIPKIKEIFNYDLDGNIIYIIIGYSPSTVMLFVKKKIQSKVK